MKSVDFFHWDNSVYCRDDHHALCLKVFCRMPTKTIESSVALRTVRFNYLDENVKNRKYTESDENVDWWIQKVHGKHTLRKAEVGNLGLRYFRFYAIVFLPSSSLVLQLPISRRAWFSHKHFATSSPSSLGSPIAYWMTGWFECVHRPYSWPCEDFFFFAIGPTISCRIRFSSPLWIVTVTLIFDTKSEKQASWRTRNGRTRFTDKGKAL